jgi:hypothetical protein
MARRADPLEPDVPNARPRPGARIVAAGALAIGVALVGYGALALFSDPRPAPVAPPAPAPIDASVPPRTLELAWPARVLRTEGSPLGQGAECSLRARVELGAVGGSRASVEIGCGGGAIYRSSAIPAYLRPAWRLDEQPGPRVGSFRYALVYQDRDSDADDHPRLRVDTIARIATIEQRGAPPSRVTLSVDELSDAVDGDPVEAADRDRAVAFRTPLAVRGRVVSSHAADAGIAIGAPCIVALRPAYDTPDWNCRARVECGGEVLYGTGASGFARCDSDAGSAVRATDPLDSTRDRDPVLDVDLAAGRARVTDRGAAPFDVVVALEPRDAGDGGR